MPKLKRLIVRGFRSIREMELELGPINVCIGANGAGKSNLIEFFKMINELMGGRLQQYIATTGRAAANLHFGPKVTPQLEAELRFEADQGTDVYQMRLFHAAGDSLIFADETLSFLGLGYDSPRQISLGAGHQEALVRDYVEDQPLINVLRSFLNRCRVYHFHDTSPTARIRQHCYIGDDRWLMPDAANLAAVLYRLKNEKDRIYRRIVRDVAQIAIASLFQAVSENVQVLISTQSSTFVDAFEPRDIVVVERNGEATTFERPDSQTLESWLEDYSLGEIWEKNVIGGSPS